MAANMGCTGNMCFFYRTNVIFLQNKCVFLQNKGVFFTEQKEIAFYKLNGAFVLQKKFYRTHAPFSL